MINLNKTSFLEQKMKVTIQIIEIRFFRMFGGINFRKGFNNLQSEL